MTLGMAAETPLIFGVFPRNNFLETYGMFLPLAKYLSKKLDREVELAASKDFATFWEGIVQRKYDLVYFNQYDYIKSHKQFGYDVILKTEELGSSTIAGTLVVRKDSDIRAVKDLKGKKVMFGGGTTAMQSYILGTYLLRQGGLKGGDYVEEFALTPLNAVIATYFGEAEAAGAGDKVLYNPTVLKTIDGTKMSYLAIGQQMAHLPWAVKKELPVFLKEKLQHELISLKENSSGLEALKKAQLSALVEAKDDEYNPHRKIVKEVLGESY